MLQIFRYSLLRLLRNRSNLFWTLLFPILLGCLFQAAFSGMYQAESLNTIPVAVVGDGTPFTSRFLQTVDSIRTSDGEALLLATLCEEEQAHSLLEEGEVSGIYYAGFRIRLEVSSTSEALVRMNQSILEEILQQYTTNQNTILYTLLRHPEHLQDVITSLSDSNSYTISIPLTQGNEDPYLQYFYNLIAMSCLFTAICGVMVLRENQGSFSALAARKNMGKTSKTLLLFVELTANILFGFVVNLIAYFFLVFVLGVDLRAHMPLAILTILISTTTGITLGFFLSVIGPRHEGAMIGVTFAVIMPACFLSGLMVGNMRMLVEKYVPILNRINPAALIADSFYSLNLYTDLTRYRRNITTLLILIAVFLTIGLVFSRRKQYDSI